MLTKAFIPYRGYYSTPFARWQGSLANENSINLGAATSKRWLVEQRLDPENSIICFWASPSASTTVFLWRPLGGGA